MTSPHDRVTVVDARTCVELWTRAAQRYRFELAVAPIGQVLLLDSDNVLHLGALTEPRELKPKPRQRAPLVMLIAQIWIVASPSRRTRRKILNTFVIGLCQD